MRVFGEGGGVLAVIDLDADNALRGRVRADAEHGASKRVASVSDGLCRHCIA